MILALLLGGMDYYLYYPMDFSVATPADYCHLSLLSLLLLRTLRFALRFLFLMIRSLWSFLFRTRRQKLRFGRVPHLQSFSGEDSSRQGEFSFKRLPLLLDRSELATAVPQLPLRQGQEEDARKFASWRIP